MSGQSPTVDELAGKLEAERGRRKRIEDELTEVRTQVQELTEAYQSLASDHQALKSRVENIAGIAEDEKSTAKKRRRDLFVTLRRKAKRNGGAFAMDYNDVKDDLAALGHGEIDDKQAFRDMRWIAEQVRGCDTSQHPVSGNEAVTINLDQVDAASLEETGASDSVSRTETGGAGSEQSISVEMTTSQT